MEGSGGVAPCRPAAPRTRSAGSTPPDPPVATVRPRVLATGPTTKGGWMSSETPAARPVDDDQSTLHRLGYAQVLYREMGGFSNFAISFTIISILAGCLTSYFIGFNDGGPVAVVWGWCRVAGFVPRAP